MYCALLSVVDEAGSRLHSESSRHHSSPQLYIQAYEVADDNIKDLLTTGEPPQKPTVLETAERGTHIAVCCKYFC